MRAARVLHLTTAQAEEFYAVHRERPFFTSLVTFMTSGPCMPMVLEKADAVTALRKAIGATDPAEAEQGTVRDALRRVQGAQRDPRLRFGRERGARVALLLRGRGARSRRVEQGPPPTGMTAPTARLADRVIFK